MLWDTFNAALELVRHYVRQGSQTELSLTGIGESLLHPRFVEAVAAARTALGPDRALVITTNGLLLTEEVCRDIAPFKPEVYISLHRPEKAGPAVEAAKKYGLLRGVNASAAISSFNWAGQLDWHVSAPRTQCEYLRVGWAVILTDGRVTTCCLDASGVGVVGTVWDAPEKLLLKPYSLCSACHMDVP